jgi:Ser/Thr protein kinase RdoA (MazF antagonist)
MTYQYSSLVESEYGLIGPLVFDQVHDGPDNNVYVVTDHQNNKYALRQSKRFGKDATFEIEILKTLALRGFSSPRVLLTKSKTSLVTVDATQLVLFTYIPGTQIEKLESKHLGSDIIERGARKLGELHFMTNRMQVTATPIRTIFTEYDRLLKLNTQKLEQFKDHEIALDQAKKFYKEAKLRISSKKDLYGIIHNDYRIQNLIYNADDCCVIDFDWACYGPLLKDLGLAIAEWSMYTRNSGPSKEAIERFIKAYNETAPQSVVYNGDLIFWICFACLSDTCTFLVDVVEGRYTDKIITNVDQCYMYCKFKYFHGE